MSAPQAASRNVFGLFVDDGRFAAPIVVWLGLSWGLLAHVRADPGWAGLVLFAGFAPIPMFDALRRPRRSIQDHGRPLGMSEPEDRE